MLSNLNFKSFLDASRKMMAAHECPSLPSTIGQHRTNQMPAVVAFRSALKEAQKFLLPNCIVSSMFC